MSDARSLESLTPAQRAQVLKDMNAMFEGPGKAQTEAFVQQCGITALRQGVIDNVYNRAPGRSYTKDTVVFHFSGACPVAPPDPSLPTLRLGTPTSSPSR